MRRALAWAAAIVTLACAPFVAIADGLVIGTPAEAYPAWARALLPLVSFAPPPVAMRAFQLPMSLGLLAALALSAWPMRAPLRVAAALGGLVGAGALLESVTPDESVAGNVAFVLYYVGIPVGVLAACGVGIAAWRKGWLPPRRAAPLALSPLLGAALTALLPQFPSAQSEALALAWAAAGWVKEIR